MKRLILLLLLVCASSVALFAERDTLRVYFEEGAETISAVQLTLIDVFLKTHFAEGQMIVAGHATDMGDPLANLNTSRTRALIAAEYLVQKGFPIDQLVVEAWGETKPLLSEPAEPTGLRNQRVELIGIVAEEEVTPSARQTLQLRDGTPIAYREMTTPAGGPKQLYVIRLERPAPIPPLLPTPLPLTPVVNTCLNVPNFRFMIPTTAQMRCPLSQISFLGDIYNAAKTADVPATGFLIPEKTDSGYYFAITLPDRRACEPPTYMIGNKCHTEWPARVLLDGVQVRDFVGNIAAIDARLIPQLERDGSYAVYYINEDPGTLMIDTVLFTKRSRLSYIKNLPLDKLPYDAATNTYTIDAANLKTLRKQYRP